MLEVLDETALHKVTEGFRPHAGLLESRRRLARDLEERLQRREVGHRRLSFGEFDGGDAQRPHVTAHVVAIVGLVLAGDDLGG